MKTIKKFYYTRTYDFKSSKGRRRRYMFQLVEDGGNYSIFRDIRYGNTETVRGVIVMDGEIETAIFDWKGERITLRADVCHPRGYAFNTPLKVVFDNQVQDIYLDTIYNRQELNQADRIFCLACEDFFVPKEIKKFTDQGKTGLCPLCGKDALYPIGKEEENDRLFPLLKGAHERYFGQNSRKEDNQ